MTEDQARQVVWVLARESAQQGLAAPWTADDRAWATRQALSVVGEDATPAAFVTARAQLAIDRMLPRDQAGQRFLARRWWNPAWVLLAMALGLLAGLLVDQLGPPQQVNLLAPAVWAVVFWNVLVYLWLLLPRLGSADPAALLRALESRAQGVTSIWLRHAAPLTGQRLLLLMHSAAAALALGLIAGLYLRGLVLDYRAGWQSTFLAPGAVQAALSLLLAPASALTGVPVADVSTLRLAPGTLATASAAPWIHLYAATLALLVVLPRLLLAAWASGRARQLAANFPLPLDLPGLRNLHPIMRPGPLLPLRLLWAAPTDLAPVRLLAAEVSSLVEPVRLWRSPQGDALDLLPLPPGLDLQAQPSPPGTAWSRWTALWRGPDPVTAALRGLRAEVDAVLWVSSAGAARPQWLADLGRPVVVLQDAAAAQAPALPLHQLADGWLACGHLLQALGAALPEDSRLQHLTAAWLADREAAVRADMTIVAQSLARMAVMRVAVADEGFLARKDDGAAARQALVQQVAGEFQNCARHLAESLGKAEPTHDALTAAPALPIEPTVRGRVGEGRAALMGGVVSGALAGLKADLLTGGLTLGAGAVAGGVLGALGAAGAARGFNAARGADHSHASWGDDTLQQLAQALLVPYLQLAQGLSAEEAQTRLRPVLAAENSALLRAWQLRPDQAAVADAAAPVLLRTVKLVLGGP